jgi:hypothetical protein
MLQPPSYTSAEEKCAYSKITIGISDCVSNNSADTLNNQFSADIKAKASKSTYQVKKLQEWFMPTGTKNIVNGGVNTGGKRDTYDKGNAFCTNKINNIQAVTLVVNDFYVYCATATDTVIQGDIKLDDTLEYTADTVPQVLIFAKNVKILSSVSRIDAFIIAEGTIDTCTNDTGSTDTPLNCAKNQLEINGPVYAQSLNLNRTYTQIESVYDSNGSSGDLTVKVKDNDTKGCTGNATAGIDKSWSVTGENGTKTWGYNVWYKEFNYRNSYQESVYAYEDDGSLKLNEEGAVIVLGEKTIYYNDGGYESQGKMQGRNGYQTKSGSGVMPLNVCVIAEPAEIFRLREDAKIWAYSETKKRQSNASVTGLTEVLPFW